MSINKNLILALLVVSLILSGCCKKKSCKLSEKNTNTSEQKDHKKMTMGEPATLKEEVAELSGNDEDVSEFAFLDEDKANKQDGKSAKVVAMNGDEMVQQEGLNEANGENPEDWDTQSSSTEEDYNLETVYFDLNKNNIRKDQLATVKNDIEQAQKLISEGKEMVVHGHCCQLGSPSYNLALSERRAKTVKDTLVKHGIPAEKVKTIGFGQEMPVVFPTSKSKKTQVKELAPNRRAEIRVA